MDLEIGDVFDSAGQSAGDQRDNANSEITRLRGPGGLLVAAFLLGMAGFMGWLYSDMLISHHAMRFWQEVPARILRTDLLHGDEGGSRTTAEYEYTFDKLTHRGTKVCWGSGYENLGSFQADALRELAEHRRTGRPFRCFVDPADPSQAILYRDLRPEILVLFTAVEMMLGVPVLLAVLGGIIQVAREWRERQFRRAAAVAHPVEPWLWRADWAAGAIVVANWPKKIGVASFALAWNLMAIPLYLNLPAAPAGTFWPRVIGFGLIGIGWLWAWWAVATWRRPKSVLRLSNVPVMCGEHFAGEIETGARPAASGQFSLTLRCVRVEEEAKSRRQRVLWEESKLVASLAPGREFGTRSVPVDFVLPADCPSTDHVADEGASRVVWRLVLDFGPGERKNEVVTLTDSTTIWGNGPAASEGLALFEVPIFSPQAYVAKADDWVETAAPAREGRAAERSIALGEGGGAAGPGPSGFAEPSPGYAVAGLAASAAAHGFRPKAPPANLSTGAFAWRWIRSCVFMAFFIAPLSLFYGLYFSKAAQWYAMRSWPEVPAKIIETRLLAPHEGTNRKPTYDVSVEYEYDFGGSVRGGTRVTYFNESGPNRLFEHGLYDELSEYRRSDQPFHCFVNPTNPNDAVLYRDLRADEMLLLAGADLSIGLVFLLVPLGVLYQFFVELGRWSFRRAELATHPNEPWLWRADWARGEIVSSNRPIALVVSATAVVWNLFAIPLWGFLPAGATTFGYRMASVVVVGIAGLLLLGAVRLWRSPKRSVLRMSEVPATPGGKLVGQIETTARPNASDGCQLALRCVRLSKMWRINDRRPTTREDVLWEAKQPAGDQPPEDDMGGSPIAVRFTIPATLPATDDVGIGDQSATRILWRLVLLADPPTKLPIATFEVPVFARPDDRAVSVRVAAGPAATATKIITS